MRRLLSSSLLALTTACTAATPATATANAPAPVPAAAKATAPTPGLSPEAEYERKLENRCNDIMNTLALTDALKASSVRQVILDQYRALHSWQETNDRRMGELKKASHSPDAAVSAKAKTDLETLMATRKDLRVAFLSALGKQLSQAQVDLVKDKMTYNKVQVTFTVYCAQNPWFTEENKAAVKAWLLEAREEAIDGGSADEKSDIFNKFKGRINNYISKNKPAK